MEPQTLNFKIGEGSEDFGFPRPTSPSPEQPLASRKEQELEAKRLSAEVTKAGRVVDVFTFTA